MFGESFTDADLAIKLAGGKNFAVVGRERNSRLVRRVSVLFSGDHVIIRGSVKKRQGITYEAITNRWEPVPNHIAVWTNLCSLLEILEEKAPRVPVRMRE